MASAERGGSFWFSLTYHLRFYQILKSGLTVLFYLETGLPLNLYMIGMQCCHRFEDLQQHVTLQQLIIGRIKCSQLMSLTCVHNMSYHVHITSLLTDFHIRRWRGSWWSYRQKCCQFDHSSGSGTVAGANRSCLRQCSSFHLLQHCMFQQRPRSGSPTLLHGK